MSELHERLVKEALSGRVSLSVRESALVNEIKNLREQLDYDLGHFRQAVDRRMKGLLEEVEVEPAPAAQGR